MKNGWKESLKKALVILLLLSISTTSFAEETKQRPSLSKRLEIVIQWALNLPIVKKLKNTRTTIELETPDYNQGWVKNIREFLDNLLRKQDR
jgi:hypothetical protein